jgi:hypothetical protein
LVRHRLLPGRPKPGEEFKIELVRIGGKPEVDPRYDPAIKDALGRAGKLKGEPR